MTGAPDIEGTIGQPDDRNPSGTWATATQARDTQSVRRGSSLNTGEAADSPDSPRAAASPTYSDPGDGYDSAIRWRADFERGDL